MNESASRSAGSPALRLILTVVVLGVAAAMIYRVGMGKVERPNHQATMISTGLGLKVENRLDARFADADGDLVADLPGDPAAILDPATLTFSYVAAEEPQTYAAVFAPLVAHLSARTGRPVEYLLIESPREQLAALRDGRLHITGLNTGSVPIAVNACGFVPVCTPGSESGMLGYTMQIIVPSASTLRSVSDLKGRTIAFTDPASNSGYKAALVILMGDFGLEPERDYLWVFSRGHIESITGVAQSRYDAAVVASDMVARMVGRGELAQGDVRVVYESEPFPTAAVGHLHNLEPALAAKVREALLSFDWSGTTVETEFAGSADRFVPVSYKNDFALVRRIDDAVGFRHTLD
jgi:phosphonate transport system substrate-binding protein